MIHLRLGTRITLWSALVVAMGMLLCGAATTAFIHRKRVGELDRQLAAEAAHFLQELDGHGGPKFDWVTQAHEPREWSPASHPPHFLEVVDQRGTLLYRTAGGPAPPREGHAPGFRDVRVNGVKMRLATFTGQGVTLRLLADYSVIDELSGDLVLAFVCSGPVMLLFVAMGSRWISRQAVTPLQRIIESAERITTQHLGQRVPIPPVQDEVHRLATVLNDTLDRLDRGFRQATRFTADASHELKTPLTVLRTTVEALLRSPDLSAADQRAVASLIEQAKRLSSITTSLLLLSRADIGKLDLELSQGDLLEVIAPCVEDAQILADEKGITIRVEAPDRAPAQIDMTRARQIVMNMLQNAVKYNRKGGEVRVTLTTGDHCWRLRISNTGPGIAPEASAQLFTRFYRGEHTSTISGNGLGISLARELAHAHGGDLEFEGSDSEWTTFTWRIPRAGNAPEPAAGT